MTRAEIKDRNAKILALRGKKSFGIIAAEFGISRSAVAGVMWRSDKPKGTKTSGTWHHGRPGPRANKTLRPGPVPRAAT